VNAIGESTPFATSPGEVGKMDYDSSRLELTEPYCIDLDASEAKRSGSSRQLRYCSVTALAHTPYPYICRYSSTHWSSRTTNST